MLAYIQKVGRKTADRGATAVEYGLLVAAIAAVIVGIVFGLGTVVKDTFTHTNDCVAAGGTGNDTNGKTCTP